MEHSWPHQLAFHFTIRCGSADPWHQASLEAWAGTGNCMKLIELINDKFRLQAMSGAMDISIEHLALTTGGSASASLRQPTWTCSRECFSRYARAISCIILHLDLKYFLASSTNTDMRHVLKILKAFLLSESGVT